MKQMKRFFITFIVSVVVLIVGFFFLAKSPTLEPSRYSQIIKNNLDIPHENDSILTIMSYNIGYLSGMTNNLSVRPNREFYRKNEKRVFELLTDLHPDLIGFQEIDYDSQRSYQVDQHDLISQNLYPYSAKAVNWDKHYVPFPYYPISVHFGKMLSGQSIMSKFLLENQKRVVLQSVESQPFYYRAFYLERLLQIVTVRHPLGTFSFMNVHAEAFDEQTRKVQLDFVYNRFKELSEKGAVILVGDFNSDINCKDSAILKFIRDGQIGKTKIIKKTYPSVNPEERLDYIFFSNKDFTLIDSDVLNSFNDISDHLPCIATLKFRSKKNS